MRMKKRLVVLLLLGGCQPKESPTLPGYIEADYVHVSTPVAGFLQQRFVNEGDSVKENTALFVINNEEVRSNAESLKAQIKKAEAELADLQKGRRPAELDALDAQIRAAKAASTLSEQELIRQKQLRKQGFSNQAALDQATSTFTQAKNSVNNLLAQRDLATQPARPDQLTAAQAAISAATAQYTQARWYVAQLAPVSPIDAEVSETYYQAGEWVPAGSPVVSLLSPSLLKIRFYIPEVQRSQLKTGQAIRISCDGCQTPIPAHIRFIANQAEFTPPVIYSKENRANLVFMVEAKPDDPAAFTLRPGQPVAINLNGSEAP